MAVNVLTHTVGCATKNDATTKECYNEQFLSIKSGCYNEREGNIVSFSCALDCLCFLLGKVCSWFSLRKVCLCF